ncbi:T-cell surface glycoprotein CD3 epsilon chain [Coregonus clupeaformis]|uniref:CD3 gamma/delta subunit Ig-like domain-containing protein n=1 Tax=Coregonus suidteri TaxID=861788 RepID=A0AAN8Q8Z2_9TELE|nr:T-cell surface glycoprotein CD3 epsilon chain [Coregonus clupeaformis]
MNRVNMNGVLIFMLAIIAVEGHKSGSVSFWRKTVTMTCPEGGLRNKDGSSITLYHDVGDKNKTIIKDYVENDNRHYYCDTKLSPPNGSYHIYIKGKVCENCFELDATLVVKVMVGDLLVTGGVILIVYLWAQKKSGPAAPQKPTSRSAGRGPPVVPSPDYESLSAATRSTDIYATHRTG